MYCAPGAVGTTPMVGSVGNSNDPTHAETGADLFEADVMYLNGTCRSFESKGFDPCDGRVGTRSGACLTNRRHPLRCSSRSLPSLRSARVRRPLATGLCCPNAAARFEDKDNLPQWHASRPVDGLGEIKRCMTWPDQLTSVQWNAALIILEVTFIIRLCSSAS